VRPAALLLHALPVVHGPFPPPPLRESRGADDLASSVGENEPCPAPWSDLPLLEPGHEQVDASIRFEPRAEFGPADDLRCVRRR
jgi:hypothetical protein